MSETGAFDVAVVGAGPVGLAAVLMLRGLGYNTVLIAPPRQASDERTSALLAGSVALLEKIGVWQHVGPKGAPLRSIRIVDATRRLIRAPEVIFDAGEINLDAFGYNIPNTALLSALEAEVVSRGIERVPTLVERVAPDRDGVGLHLSNGRSLMVRLVAAADGRRSVVRESVGISTREWRYDQAALVVNFRHGLPHEGISTEFHTEHGPFTLVPLGDLRSSLVWVDRPEESERRSKLPDEALAREIEERAASILGAVAIDGPRQVFPISGMLATRFGKDRAVLLGEAAHLFPPIGAQGLNLGYRDVVALGEVLAGPVADPGERVAAYDRARRSDVLTRTAAVDALNRTLLTGFLPVQGIRGAGLFLLDRVPALRRAVMRQGVAGAY